MAYALFHTSAIHAMLGVVVRHLGRDKARSRLSASTGNRSTIRAACVAGIIVDPVNERGTSSTCPACRRRIPKPRGRTLTCPHCQFAGHHDLVAAAIIATRTPGGGPTTPTTAIVPPGVVTHRRAGRHLPGAGQSRRDPRRPPPVTARGSIGPRRPAPARPGGGESLAHAARIHNTTPDGRRRRGRVSGTPGSGDSFSSCRPGRAHASATAWWVDWRAGDGPSLPQADVQ